jgi:hypothetical protein
MMQRLILHLCPPNNEATPIHWILLHLVAPQLEEIQLKLYANGTKWPLHDYGGNLTDFLGGPVGPLVLPSLKRVVMDFDSKTEDTERLCSLFGSQVELQFQPANAEI